MAKDFPTTVRTTILEMNRAPGNYPSLQISAALAIMKVPEIPISFYRYLYAEIGKSHYWYSRNHASDAELKILLHSSDTQIRVLYCDGAPAGFVELDYSQLPQSIQIIYFGLCPQFLGRGLGKWFLGQIIKSAWEEKPEKLTVSTHNLDHARALRLYQKFGFAPVAYKVENMTDWLQSQN